MKIRIKNRWLFTCAIEEVSDDCASPERTAVEQAVARGTSLTEANLTGARLNGANLTGAKLTGARLNCANLTGAILTGAILTGADLIGADLTKARLNGTILNGAILNGADLTGAKLTGAILTGTILNGAILNGAILNGADLTGAILTGAILTGADLTGAILTGVREDFRSVLDAAPNEAAGLLLALREGRINGSQYKGKCACLIGTIANLRGCEHTKMPDIQPNESRPSERLFTAISPGHLPSTNPVAKIVEGWILEWQADK